jgi:hypothetical protein
MSCLKCGSPVPSQRPYCGVCILAVRAEIEQGLLDLDDYLAGWAAFAAWCEASGRTDGHQSHGRATTNRYSTRREEGVTMELTDQTYEPYRELAHRVADGLEVVLFWRQVTNELIVSVSDERTGAYYEVAAAQDNALDVFDHPYAYAASMGLPYEEASLPAWAAAATGAGRGASSGRL